MLKLLIIVHDRSIIAQRLFALLLTALLASHSAADTIVCSAALYRRSLSSAWCLLCFRGCA